MWVRCELARTAKEDLILVSQPHAARRTRCGGTTL
jgi:hypothetical protein